MKPLAEWTETELKNELYDGGQDGGDCLAELLRRERERCAKECERLAEELDGRERQGAFPDGDWSMQIRGYKTAARFIRGLQ